MNKITENIFLLDEKGYEEQGILVECPTCHCIKKIHMPQNMVKKRGLTTISIPKDTICKHYFQIFLDEKLVIRGYQKVDFRIFEDLKSIQFRCQLCNTKIKFRPNDESSYLSMEPYKRFLGKNLRSFKIIHYHQDEMHVNTIIIENDCDLYEILSSIAVKLETYDSKENISLKFFKYKEKNRDVFQLHPLFNSLVLFNSSEHWMYDLVCSPLFNSVDLSRIIFKKVQNTMNNFSEAPFYMSIEIADILFHIWIFQSNIICLNLKNEQNIDWLKPVLLEFIENATLEHTLISNCPRLLLMSEFFKEDKITSENIPLIKRLLLDDLLYSRIQIRYLDKIDRILSRLILEFNIDKVFVFGFFFQSRSIVDFTRKLGNYQDFEEFVDVIDFINRRNLLE